MLKTKTSVGNERGFASIVIALILIIVLALLTVGFAQFSRREQQSALDKQLAVQAKYAAESGINDVVQGIANGTITSSSGSSCLAQPQYNNVQINPTTGAAYTCEIVNLTPNYIVNAPTQANESWATTFTSQLVPDTLNISWYTDGTSNAPSSINNKFLTNQSWTNSSYPALL